MLLARKDEVHWLEEQDEEGMVHSLLSSLPTITDEEETPKASAEEDEYLPLEPDAEEGGSQLAVYPAQSSDTLANDSDVATAASIPLPPSRPSSPTNLVEHRSSSPQGPPRPTIPLSSLLPVPLPPPILSPTKPFSPSNPARICSTPVMRR